MGHKGLEPRLPNLFEMVEDQLIKSAACTASPMSKMSASTATRLSSAAVVRSLPCIWVIGEAALAGESIGQLIFKHLEHRLAFHKGLEQVLATLRSIFNKFGFGSSPILDFSLEPNLRVPFALGTCKGDAIA